MQAVFNLVQNAAQALGKRPATSPGAKPGGNIWIDARVGPATHGSAATGAGPDAVHLTVRDDGPGMDARTAARCTEAFFTTKAKDLGTGLGLFLVRTVVERHGGKLVVESTPGEGSLFTLILPVASANPAAPATPRAAARAR
jgi:signal transduction histidine kinase